MAATPQDPLHSPRLGATTFAVRLYNRTVRAQMKDNLDPAEVNERWAEPQMHQVCANSAEEARQLVAGRFPADQGWVIDTVSVATPDAPSRPRQMG